ncbi:hypothetical protein B0H66DRAFT_393663 [Apodospora peruviana]|uniref:Hemerythrin-like domain-containing protein n=1 Tax=Apodospora peruviana TaxID=516989 RepID=A0AAE0HSH7_9PEZI|nr:hypothetical protein B0H66DRAFT_393663 [Apodospora peruviana]
MQIPTRCPCLSDGGALRVARLMALTHNTIFRAFNAIYTQAPNVDPSNAKDVSDLMQFATFAIAFLENHHQSEELVFFPMLEAQAQVPGLMAENVDQHRAFDSQTLSLRQYIQDIQSGEERFDASLLRGHIDELSGPLEAHLKDEIPSLRRIGRQVGDGIMTVCYKALHDEAEGTTDPYQIGPLVLGCQDHSFTVDGLHIQFPELPFSWAPSLVDHLVSRRHAGAWRFCPSDFYGQIHETEFFKFAGESTPEGETRLTVASNPRVTRSPFGVLTVLLLFVLLIVISAGMALDRMEHKWW